MLFLFKYIDDLIGKGFEWYTIFQLMMYASAFNVAMALPLSILLSSIMTYGSLGENYELVAIKSAGISLQRAMYPMVIIVTTLSVSAFFFSDYMLPIANLKYYSLLYDVRQQKSANILPENVFSGSFPGYTIRVRKKDPDGRRLYGIMIYERNNNNNNTDVLIAKEGEMYRTGDNDALVLKLKDGVRYTEKAGDNSYNYREQLIRYRFKETEQIFDLSSFKIHRTDEKDFKGAYQMMNLHQLSTKRDTLQHLIDSGLAVNYKLITPYLRYYTVPLKSKTVKQYSRAKPFDFYKASRNDQINALANASNEARSIQDILRPRADKHKDADHTIRRYMVEYQRKFTLSAICLSLFLIGAPLGAIIRKGGLGMPVVVAVIFFLFYYIISTIGEKSAKDGNLSPFIGMWISIIILTPIGLFLSYKAANDSVLFDMEAYKRTFNKFFKRKDI